MFDPIIRLTGDKKVLGSRLKFNGHLMSSDVILMRKEGGKVSTLQKKEACPPRNVKSGIFVNLVYFL